MFSYPVQKLPTEKFLDILKEIPFYYSVFNQDEKQFNIILEHSKIFLAESLEIVIRKGDIDGWCYYILKGKLNVFAGSHPENEKPIAHLFPGELFGSLAMLQDTERNASIQIDVNCQRALLLGLDLAPFGDFDDFEEITLQTKVAYYHAVFSKLKLRIVKYLTEFPDNSLVGSYDLTSSYEGDTGTLEELKFYTSKTIDFTNWLTQWNASLDGINTVRAVKKSIRTDLISDIEDFLWNRRSQK